MAFIWQPNGLGCSTDNREVGGQGGFMAIPNSPTPNASGYAPGVGFTTPEKNGLFGSTALTYTSAGGNFFTLQNPGRSA